MLVAKSNIEQYIPHRKPFVMVDTLESQEEQVSVSTFAILSDNYLVDEGFFTEGGLVENIAQTAALRPGYEYVTNNLPVPLGFIGGINKLKINSLPPVGVTITTKVTVLNEVFNVSSVLGEVYLGDDCLASCELKIVIDK